MAKEKADSDKRGWFARWRERRARSKLRASEIQRSRDEQDAKNIERQARTGGGYGPGRTGGGYGPGL